MKSKHGCSAIRQCFREGFEKLFRTNPSGPRKSTWALSPAKLLDRLYRSKIGRVYKKTVDGVKLFKNLDPEGAAKKCPYLKLFLDELVNLAKAAGIDPA
jgi:hypothetical protein